MKLKITVTEFEGTFRVETGLGTLHVPKPITLEEVEARVKTWARDLSTPRPETPIRTIELTLEMGGEAEGG